MRNNFNLFFRQEIHYIPHKMRPRITHMQFPFPGPSNVLAYAECGHTWGFSGLLCSLCYLHLCFEAWNICRPCPLYQSISSRSGARKLQRLPWLKYYHVLKQESRFILGPNAAKNTDYIEKHFKQKLFRIQ